MCADRVSKTLKIKKNEFYFASIEVVVITTAVVGKCFSGVTSVAFDESISTHSSVEAGRLRFCIGDTP